MIPLLRVRCPRSAFFLVLALLVLGGTASLPGCARKAGPFPAGERPSARDVWKGFKVPAGQEPGPAALRLTASLNYIGPERSGRVVLRFWGNLDYPLRLDARTGLGPVVAYCREDAKGFLAYVPEENSAWIFPDGREGMAAFGVELPFTLRQLGLILAGRAGEVFPAGYVSAGLVPEQGFEYILPEGGGPARLALDFFSRPLEWTGTGDSPWHIEFGGYEDIRDTSPAKLKFFQGESVRAVLFVKEAEFLGAPWAEEQLELVLPKGAGIRFGPGS